MSFLFAALVFIIIIIIFGSIYAFTSGVRESDIIRGRLEAIEKGDSYGKIKNTLDLDLIRDELLSSIPAINKMLVKWSWPERMRKFIAQAGMQVRPGKMVLIGAILGLLTLQSVRLIYGNLVLGLLLAIPAVFIPLIYIAMKRARRLAAFHGQFPEVIDLLSRSMRAGHSFAAGMEIASTDLPAPVATEFRIAFDEQRFGLPLRDALLNLCDRVPLVDVRLFVIALLVQKETGGNLVEILDKLAHVIRERFRIAGEVRIRTAQGRLTAVILIAMPLVVLWALHFLDPEYVNLLFFDRLGQVMITTAAALQVIGALLVWKIVSIKV